MILRSISKAIKANFNRGKAIMVLGPRQSGKTTLIKSILDDFDQRYIELNGDEPDIREHLTDITSTQLKALIGKRQIIFIDEAQRVKNIGLTLKLIVDQIKDVQVIASGSSSFEIANEINEPITGRKYEFRLFPLSFSEMVDHHELLEEKRLLEHRLIFGYYPEIVTKIGEEKRHLKLLASSYLYKDLLTLEQIKKPALLEKILKALALQVGNEVSFHEIAQLVGADYGTIERYVDFLEKSYVIFSLTALSRNVRNEIKKGKKIYFYDNGIRNAIIGNYNLLNSRTDTGALWENFIISERMKLIAYNDMDVSSYFWRTTQQQEIDYIEETADSFFAHEIKWNPNRKARISKTFRNAYHVKEAKIIHRENFETLLLN